MLNYQRVSVQYDKHPIRWNTETPVQVSDFWAWGKKGTGLLHCGTISPQQHAAEGLSDASAMPAVGTQLEVGQRRSGKKEVLKSVELLIDKTRFQDLFDICVWYYVLFDVLMIYDWQTSHDMFVDPIPPYILLFQRGESMIESHWPWKKAIENDIKIPFIVNLPMKIMLISINLLDLALTLWLCQQFAVENGHLWSIMDLPIKNRNVPIYVKLPEGTLICSMVGLMFGILFLLWKRFTHTSPNHEPDAMDSPLL